MFPEAPRQARTKLEAEIGNDEDVAGPQEAKLKHMSGRPGRRISVCEKTLGKGEAGKCVVSLQQLD